MTQPWAAPPHPAPARHSLSHAALLFGLTAAPLAWAFQTIVGMAIARHACYPKNVPLALPAFSYAHILIAGIIVVSLVISLASIAVSFAAWRRTRKEFQGDGHELLEIGEGRTRFLAMCALIISVGFTGAIVFAIPGVIVAPLC